MILAQVQAHCALVQMLAHAQAEAQAQLLAQGQESEAHTRALTQTLPPARNKAQDQREVRAGNGASEGVRNRAGAVSLLKSSSGHRCEQWHWPQGLTTERLGRWQVDGRGRSSWHMGEETTGSNKLTAKFWADGHPDRWDHHRTTDVAEGRKLLEQAIYPLQALCQKTTGDRTISMWPPSSRSCWLRGRVILVDRGGYK